jgi:transcriptional regulator with XRE-family HTH domain
MAEAKRPGRPRKPRPAGLLGEIGERIETLRKAKGWTQADFAKRLNVAMSTVAKMERGEYNLTVRFLADITRGLGVSCRDLLSPCKSW